MSIDPSRFRRIDTADTPQTSAPRYQPYRPAQPVKQAQPMFPERRQPDPAPTQPKPVPSNPTPQPSTNVTINISMPRFKKPHISDQQRRRIKRWVYIIVGLIVISVMLHYAISFAIHRYKAYEDSKKLAITNSNLPTKPSFSPAVPQDHAAAIAKTAAYDPRRDSYSYSDTLKGLQVVVSQQRLPNGATDATIAKIAKGMNATTPLITGKGTAFIASNSGGAQLVVLGTKSLLIFVQSPFTHSTADWTSYLDTLQA